MSAWEPIIIRDLEDARHAELVEAVRRKALAIGQPDPLPKLIQDTIDEIRGCIGFKSPTKLDADETKLARNLKPLTIGKIAREMVLRLGRTWSDTDDKAESTYQKRLEQLRDGDWPVDAPDTAIAATAQAPASGISVAKKTKRLSTRHTLGAL